MKQYNNFQYELTPFATDKDEQALTDWIDTLGKNPTEIPDVDDEHYDKWCCEYDFAGIDTLVLPKSVKKIGKCAFAQSELGSLVADGVELIDELAFYNTERLYRVSAPNCRTLVADCFNHSHVSELNLPQLESVGRYCFYDMPRIKTINLPSLRGMDSYAIYGCDALTEVNLGMLENAEFSIITKNKNLNKIIAKFLKSKDLLAMHSNADPTFVYGQPVSETVQSPIATEYDSETLERAKVKEDLEYQYHHPRGFRFNLVSGLDEEQTKLAVAKLFMCFDACVSENFAVIPKSENAGKDESASDVFKFLKDIYLPEEIKSIGDYAFAKCYGLESVVAPGVETVKDHAFYCDGALRYVDLPACRTLAADSFNGAGYDTYSKIFVPQVETVGKHAFWQTGFVCLDMPHCETVASTAIEENEKLMAVRVGALKCENAINLNPNLVKLEVGEGKNAVVDQAVYACPCVSKDKTVDKK